MNMEKEEWIERSLCDADRARSACKVIITERNAVVAKGDNYTSELSRLKMKVLLYSGEVEERSVIYKCLPSTELMRKYIRDTGLFTTERRMYSDVLPKMEKIRREFESGEPLWGECYAVHGYESFLLQDLQVLGYKMGERIKGLDFEHCCFVMQSLAKFHALAAVLKERGQIILSDYDKYFIERNFSMMGTFYNSSFEGLCKTVENEFGEEWQPILEKLRKLSKTVSEEILKVVALNKKHKFNTLNHGDCWVNNMLFKYGPDEKPISTSHHHGKKGHHEKEGHNGGFHDHSGHKHKHHDEGGYFAEHHKGDHGHHGHKYEESGKYGKGHSTKGEHVVHKLDEYKKKKEFYDEDHDEAHHEKHGDHHHGYEHKKGGHHKKGHYHAGHSEDEKGKKGHGHHGHHHHSHAGHKKEGGHSEKYGHHNEHGKKGGKEEHKKWGYSHHGKHH